MLRGVFEDFLGGDSDFFSWRDSDFFSWRGIQISFLERGFRFRLLKKDSDFSAYFNVLITSFVNTVLIVSFPYCHYLMIQKQFIYLSIYYLSMVATVFV